MRLFLYSLFFFLSLVSCGKKHEAQETHSPTEELAARYDIYHALALRGWSVEEDCDALLFVSLQHVGLAEPGPVEEAQSEPGHWFRLPEPEYASKCSSDISRDMFVGLFTYIWTFHRRDLAEGIWDYGSQHGWKMGEERLDLDNRTILSPSMIGLLAEMIWRMGGADHAERLIPAVFNTDPGFTSHLTLLHIRLLGEMRNSLTDYELSTLRAISKHMASNPLVHAILHKYTDGDQSVATNLLLNTWPVERLPTSSDWCEHWRTQRSDGDTGFNSCSEQGHTHSGGDFLFTAALILGKGY